MGTFLQYRDGGKSDEKGISTHLSGLFQGEVINGLAVSQGSPLGMTVNVSKGRCMIDSGDDYPYLGFTDDIETVTISTADGSNPRIDAIVGYVDLSVVDSTNANNPDAFLIVAVPGTPAGSPNAPNDGAVESAIGLGNPFIRLAHVTVGSGVTTITNGNVSNQRVMVSSPDDFIGTNQIKTNAVTTAKINDGAVISRKLKPTEALISSNNSLTLATSSADVPGATVTFTPDVASICKITVFGEVLCNGGVAGIFLNVDGSTINPSMTVQNPTANNFVFAPSRTYRVPLTAASHTIKLMASRGSGSTGTINPFTNTATGFHYELISQ